MANLKPGWRRVKFGEVVRLNKETCKNPAAEGIDRYIGLEHLEPGDLRIRSWGDVSDGTTFTNRVRPGQVLFGKRRAYQRKVAVADFDAVCSGDIYVFESTNPDRLLPDLLPFLCQTDSFFEYAVGTSAGSLSPRTNWTSLAEYEFALPPMEEQRRARTVLDAGRMFVDALRALSASGNLALRAWLNQLAVGLLSSGPVVPLSVVLDGSPDSGCSAPARDSETGYWVLGLSALSDSGYVDSDYKSVDPTPAMLSAKLKDGDLLITRSNTRERVGFVGRFVSDGRDVSFPDTMMRLHPKAGRVLPDWLELILQATPIRGAIQATAAGTSASMKKINRANLLAVRLPDVSLEIQREHVRSWHALRLASIRACERERQASLLYRRFVAEVLSA